MTTTKTSTLHERVLSIALLALDNLKDTPTPEGFAGVLFTMLKKGTEKNPSFLSDMIGKQIASISEAQMRAYIVQLRDELIPYILGDNGESASDQNPGR